MFLDMSLFETQLIILFVVLIGTFLCGILPIFCFRYLNCFSVAGNGSKITSLLIFFGGGIFFATSLLHLLPEAREQLRKIPHHFPGKSHLFNITDAEISHPISNITHHHSEYGHKHGFAFPEFVLLCGFFLTYLMEEIIRFLLKRRNSNGISEDQIKFCSCAQRNMECSKTYKDLNLERSSLITVDKTKRKRSLTWAGQDNREQSFRHDTFVSPPPVSRQDLLRSSIISQPKYGSVATGETIGLPMRVDGGITLVNRPVVSAIPPVTAPDIVITPPSTAIDSTAGHKISFTSLLTVAALSFHSVFEGIAMGFQPTVTSTWTLFFAVAMHKFVIAFVIGTEAVIENSRVLFIVSCMAVFSIMSPIGMVVAIFLGGSNESGGPFLSQFMVGIINCIAAGTLLYVTFLDILKRKTPNLCGFQQLLAIAFGFLLMSSLQFATSEF